MMINVFILELIVLMVVFVMSWFLWDKLRPKRIFVIEDCESDRMLFKININVKNVAFNYYSSVDGIIADIALHRPDAVIIDYLLAGKTRGDRLLEYCELNKINSVLVTGYEGDILGVDKSKIIRKSAEREYYETVENWIKRAVA